MTCKQYVFAYLRNKYYCLLCTSFYANPWEYNHGLGRQVCCLHRADERPRQREERETEREGRRETKNTTTQTGEKLLKESGLFKYSQKIVNILFQRFEY